MRAALTVLALLVVAAPAQANGPRNGKYEGRTSQNLTIKITVKDEAIAKFVVFVKNDCGATEKPIRVAGPIEIDDNRDFEAKLSGSQGTLRLSGHFGNQTVKGTVRERSPNEIVGSGTCDTGKVSFNGSRS